ncbi:hydantoinase B/oxoprolinase family protein [Streptomyces sp. NPDC057257]|uniref:hydantoinase B/oxoprolinase family protein n=1 Tax=Streptomyces sp. NPDC057257 TaxID=3346071 RepID=UPI00362D17AE
MTVHPVTYEVIRHRLLSITEEMRVALQSVSGSPTVTEATDFFTGLYVPDGSFATMGFQVTHEAPPVGALIRHLGATGRPVRDGDMFIGNDPYVGALHQNDVQMAGPIFHEGEIVAWAGVMAHETDMGGMNFASWCPDATEVFQEGLRIPAVKLVDRGEVRDDVLEMILAATRLPAALGLDIRAFIATLNVARDRLSGLFARYGADQVGTVMHRMIDETERATRHRLAELPDATVRVRDFLEHDGHENRLYTVDLVATKTGEELVLDFGGSSPQAPGFINATRPGLTGGVTGALIPTLGFGIPWNAGLLRPVRIEAPDGLVCTAQHPAPVGSATVETIWVVTNVVQKALNLLLAASERHAHRAQAVSSGTMATFNLGGVNQFGERFGLHLLDPLAGGSGAFASQDGVHAGGPVAVPMPAVADVESNEQVSPLFYRHRRLRPGSGGAGRHRGGDSAEIALTLRGVAGAEALVMTHGAEVPNSSGLFGGWPGATVEQRFNGEPLGPKPGRIPMRPGDVFEVSWQGGGGFGDPKLREYAAVAADLAAGLLTEQQAHEIYGLDADDVGGTTVAPDAPGRPLGPALRLVETADGVEVRTIAGAVLSRGTTRWRAGAVARSVDPTAHGITLHEDLTMTAFSCPVSGIQLAVDVHRRDQSPLDDLELHVPAAADPNPEEHGGPQ